MTFCTSEGWLGHPGTVGKPWPEADVRVIGADGQSLPAGEVGEEFGEGVCAVVQPSDGAEVTEASVKAYLREDSGRIFKRKLREPFWEGLERRI